MDTNEIMEYVRYFASDAMYFVGVIVMMIVSLATCKKHGLSKLSAFMFTLVSYVGGFSGAFFMADVFTKVSVSYGGGSSRVAIFGAILFVPFYIIGAALLSGKSWRKVMDAMAPGGFIILTCAKFGCSVSGCCPGIPTKFGIYNHMYDMVMFPSQILEAISMCFVVAFCFWYGLKYKKREPGKAYPLTVILYSAVRFCWEFVRYYEVEEMRHMLLGLTFWQLWCIVAFAGGCVWLLIMKIPKLPQWEEKYYSFYEKLISKIKSKVLKKKNSV